MRALFPDVPEGRYFWHVAWVTMWRSLGYEIERSQWEVSWPSGAV